MFDELFYEFANGAIKRDSLFVAHDSSQIVELAEHIDNLDHVLVMFA